MKMENDLGKDDIGRLVWRIAIPSMLAQFVSVLYSIVDRIYIGNIPQVGDVALAGVGVCGPVVTLVGSAAFLVGIGGSPLMSISMGEKNLRHAEKILANCFLMLCVLSVVLMAVLFPLRSAMLMTFGASETTFPYAMAYFTIYLIGTPFALLSTGMNQFIICQGFAKIGMISVMLGAVLNIVLDPLFIFGFDMGVQGGALATVLSQLGSCIFVLAFLFSRRVPVRIHFGGYRFSIMRQVLKIGFTPFIIIAVDSVMIIAMNAVLQHYGGPSQGDTLVTCATIAQSFMLVVTMPLGGISGGTQTILGFNYGACNTQRVRQAVRRITMMCVGYTGILFILAHLAGPLFVRLFTQDEALAELAFDSIKICTLAILPLGLQYEMVDSLTAIGQVRLSLPLSFFRKLVYFGALFVLPIFFAPQYVFFAEPISDLISPIVSFLVFRRNIGPILRRREEMARSVS